MEFLDIEPLTVQLITALLQQSHLNSLYAGTLASPLEASAKLLNSFITRFLAPFLQYCVDYLNISTQRALQSIHPSSNCLKSIAIYL